jgi:hypothetical protein
MQNNFCFVFLNKKKNYFSSWKIQEKKKIQEEFQEIIQALV